MTLEQRIEAAQNSLAAATTDEQKQLLSLGIEKLKDLLSQQKKSEEPIEKSEQLEQPKRPEKLAAIESSDQRKQRIAAGQEQREKAFENKGWEKVREALPAMARAYDETIKTIKAPVIDREPEYINIELTDQKGAKYIRTYNRAQTKALCRKYFSNVHNAWVGGNRKLTNGFDNLLAYFLGWVEFDGRTPGLQDVLQDYFRYKKASEKSEDSEAFKVAKELYDKIILVTSKLQ